MKAKLIKTEVNYILEDDKGVVIASTSLNKEGLSLSIKNCQAIERGYDLDELVKSKYPNFYNEDYEYDVEAEMLRDEYKSRGFKEGFQKAVEILGDKKFSEKDVMLIAEYIRVASQSTPNVRTKDLFDEYQSLQQTEWDVEIEMICPHPEDTYVCGIQYGCDEDGCNHPNQVPLLDADGCLILKRI